MTNYGIPRNTDDDEFSEDIELPTVGMQPAALDAHPRMCGFIRTPGVNILACYKSLCVSEHNSSHCLISFKINDFIESEKDAKERLYERQKKTGTLWCIIYSKFNGHQFNIIPDPRDKRNNNTFDYNYKEVLEKGCSTYRLSHC
jgi:hypothetical protein